MASGGPVGRAQARLGVSALDVVTGAFSYTGRYIAEAGQRADAPTSGEQRLRDVTTRVGEGPGDDVEGGHA